MQPDKQSSQMYLIKHVCAQLPTLWMKALQIHVLTGCPIVYAFCMHSGTINLSEMQPLA